MNSNWYDYYTALYHRGYSHIITWSPGNDEEGLNPQNQHIHSVLFHHKFSRVTAGDEVAPEDAAGDDEHHEGEGKEEEVWEVVEE